MIRALETLETRGAPEQPATDYGMLTDYEAFETKQVEEAVHPIGNVYISPFQSILTLTTNIF